MYYPSMNFIQILFDKYITKRIKIYNQCIYKENAFANRIRTANEGMFV